MIDVLSAIADCLSRMPISINTDLRVTVNPDGTIDLLDFRLVKDGDTIRTGLRQEDVPTWIIESISMLRIANERDLVPGLGFKISDHVYYIVDKTGATNET